jgi:ferritin-like metal-binding protein YciE
LTLFDLGGAAKTEHYEIAPYRGVIEKANLMAQKVEQISRQLGKQFTQQQAGQPV